MTCWFVLQPPSEGSEEVRVDKLKTMLDSETIRKLAASLSAATGEHKEELSDEELERRRNALLLQLHEEAD